MTKPKKNSPSSAKAKEPIGAKAPETSDPQGQTKARWSIYGAKHLVGRTIRGVRYMTPKEVEDIGWYSAAVVLLLDDGSLLFPSRDDEGNDAGALFGQTKKGEDITLPVI